MRFIIEFDGIIVGMKSVWYAVYRNAAEAVGWSRMDEASFWRLTRKGEPGARLLSGASPVKVKAYEAQFDLGIEDATSIERYEIRPEVAPLFKRLSEQGTVSLVTLGTNVAARRNVTGQGSWAASSFEALNEDPRRRPTELKVLSDGDPRTIVVASSDSLLRAAGGASLFCVGIAHGASSVRRLHQAGADIVVDDLPHFASALEKGAPTLVEAGLLPASLG